jgi:uncharacterized protein
MAKGTSTVARSKVQRRDRIMNDDDRIRSMLRCMPVCTVATVNDGQPFINTNIFVYDEAANVIYMHTARSGRTRSNVGTDPRICLSVFRMGRLLPAARAKNFSAEYEAVVVFGHGEVVEDFEEARHASRILMAKYAPHLQPEQDFALPSQEELEMTAFYRIRIEEWSGKRNQAPEDFPGAFLYSDQAR